MTKDDLVFTLFIFASPLLLAIVFYAVAVKPKLNLCAVGG